MAYYDIYPPVVKLGRTFDLDTKRRLVLQAMKPLGEPYVAALGKATAAKGMDALPKPGKASGAYMNGGAYDVHPYLLLNLYDDYDGLTTFAHEWGHAMHSVLANAAQPYPTADYTIFTAEIASTNNEQLLAHYMAANAKSREEKLFYLCQAAGTSARHLLPSDHVRGVRTARPTKRPRSGQALSGLHGSPPSIWTCSSGIMART